MNNLPPPPYGAPQQAQPTVITDIDIPFSRLIVIILKTLFASIPAMICFYLFLTVVIGIAVLLFGGLFAGLSSALQHNFPDLQPPQR